MQLDCSRRVGVQMTKPCVIILAGLVLMSALATTAEGYESGGPKTVVVHNGSVTLHALLWRPQGHGPFPAILLNHGSGRTREELKRLGPYEQQADILGPVFARHGYVFLFLFRRGVGLSADQGTNAVDMMNSEFSAHGQEARNKLQLQLLETREMSDALSGLAFLRALPDVDPHNVAVVGHSFGGSLTLLMAEHEPNLRAIVVSRTPGIAGIGRRSCERGSLLQLLTLGSRYSSFTLQTTTRSPRVRRWARGFNNSANLIS